MKNKIVILLEIISICLIAYLLLTKKAEGEPLIPQLTPYQLDLIHRQEIWISALEYCESRGLNSALNKKDLDGTPSYSNFQWKPSTLLGFGKQYGLISTDKTIKDVPELLKDYELQRSIVRKMINDPQVKLKGQFPGCVKKLGLPPKQASFGK